MITDFITVGVLCYNSEKTIIDTLDSIKRQTYKKIILLINDDSSKDSSVEIIKNWISKNEVFFKYVNLFEHENNCGINFSFDFLIRKCETNWIKLIAGDDILFDDCIEKNLFQIQKNNVETILYSSVIPFCKANENIVEMKKDLYENYYARKISDLSPKKQYKKLLKRDIIFSSTVFMNAPLYLKLGGICLDIKNIEDWPLRLLFTKNGYKLFYFDEDTVFYRIGDSISHDSKTMYNIKHIQQSKIFKEKIIYPYISKFRFIYYLSEFLESFRYFLIIKIFKNKRNTFVIFINKFLMFFEFAKLPERVKKFFMKIKKKS